MDKECNGGGENGDEEMAEMMKALAKKKHRVLAKSLTGGGGLDVTLKNKNDGEACKSIK